MSFVQVFIFVFFFNIFYCIITTAGNTHCPLFDWQKTVCLKICGVIAKKKGRTIKHFFQQTIYVVFAAKKIKIRKKQTAQHNVSYTPVSQSASQFKAFFFKLIVVHLCDNCHYYYHHHFFAFYFPFVQLPFISLYHHLVCHLVCHLFESRFTAHLS